MTDETYQPVLSPKEAQEYLDSVYRIQLDEIPRADLGEDGPRPIPLTTGRQAALAVFKALGNRRGCDLRDQDIDAEILGEIVDEATDIINQAFNLGAGPVTVAVARELNQLHEAGRDWDVSYTAKDKEFQVSAVRADNGMEYVRSDSLFEAIMSARNAVGNANESQT